ncbi:hypothetical protein D3C71_2069640 [compost metagenome]
MPSALRTAADSVMVPASFTVVGPEICNCAAVLAVTAWGTKCRVCGSHLKVTSHSPAPGTFRRLTVKLSTASFW